LHCHSHYSFLRGAASPEEIVAAAVEQKMPAVALTDTNGLYAAVKFYKLAQNAGIKAIVGVVLDVEFRISSAPSAACRTSTSRNSKNETRNSASAPLTLLAADMDGYSNLCQLVTLRHLGTTQLSQNMDPAETDGRPVTMQELAEHSRGVIALASLPPRSHDAGARRGAACCAPTKTTKANCDCLSAANHQSRISSYFLHLTEISGTTSTSKCSTFRREMDARCARRSALATNWACGW